MNSPKNYPELVVDIEKLKKTVWFLSKMQPSRNYQHTQSLDRISAFIQYRFSEYGLLTTMQPFEVDAQQYINVIGTCGEENAERVIVGAHYDVCGDQPGADDNASAIAGLLEIARLVKLHSPSLSCRVDFVAYALEEPPFFLTEKMGSYIHARSLSEQQIPLIGMICLEMIGYFTNAKASQNYPLELMKSLFPSVGNFIAVAGNLKSRQLVETLVTHLRMTLLKVQSVALPPPFDNALALSDHLNYWKFGYHAVMVTDTAMYRNPNYHKSSDTMETLDFESMGEIVKGVVWTLLNLV